MGGTTSSPAQQQQKKIEQGECLVKHDQTLAATGGCPVKHDQTPAAAAAADGCPVKHKGGKQQYNVYAQPIDPSNQMPFNPNQIPVPGQEKDLSTERVKSFIPKGGSDSETWQYPSPQMFYNALMRKGKGEDVDILEMDTIVAVHNNMNERAWNMVVSWEKNLHAEDFEAAGGVKLSRFMGRPDDKSPMAWVKSTFLGYPKPFDRHDWYIDRNGKEVRYVIDYYYDEVAAKGDETPGLHDIKSVKSISMDARPAIDSVTALVDRVRYPFLMKAGMLHPVKLEENACETVQNADNNENENYNNSNKSTTFENMDNDEMQVYSKFIVEKCSDCVQKVNTCATETECQKASIALTHCMAAIVCKPEAMRFNKDMTSEEDFDGMVDCMGRFETQALKIRKNRQ